MKKPQPQGDWGLRGAAGRGSSAARPDFPLGAVGFHRGGEGIWVNANALPAPSISTHPR